MSRQNRSVKEYIRKQRTGETFRYFFILLQIFVILCVNYLDTKTSLHCSPGSVDRVSVPSPIAFDILMDKIGEGQSSHVHGWSLR